MEKTKYFIDEAGNIVLIIPNRNGYVFKPFQSVIDANEFITNELETTTIKEIKNETNDY